MLQAMAALSVRNSSGVLVFKRTLHHFMQGGNQLMIGGKKK
jgi:hypothetical protein